MNLTTSYATSVLMLVSQYGTIQCPMWNWQGKWKLSKKINSFTVFFTLSPATLLLTVMIPPQGLYICSSFCLECPSTKYPLDELALSHPQVFISIFLSIKSSSITLKNTNFFFLRWFFFLSTYYYLIYHLLI